MRPNPAWASSRWLNVQAVKVPSATTRTEELARQQGAISLRRNAPQTMLLADRGYEQAARKNRTQPIVVHLTGREVYVPKI